MVVVRDKVPQGALQVAPPGVEQEVHARFDSRRRDPIYHSAQKPTAASVRSPPEKPSESPHQTDWELMELRVLSLGSNQDRDVGVGVLPEREEVLVSSQGLDPGGVGIGAP